MRSQLGFLILLCDEKGNCNVLHYGSSKCKRVTRSVMAAEIHALSYGFDCAIITKSIIEELVQRSLPLHAYVDSKTLFNVIAKDASTTEKRLQIDVHVIRESRDKRELETLAWIPGKTNPADGLTKGIIGNDHPLWKVINSNAITIKPDGWTTKIE